MSRNVISRADLRDGVVECPLCGRQFVNPVERLVVYGAVERTTVENADAVECPVCDGVAFIVDDSEGTE